MRYEIMGPLRVIDEDGRHSLGARKIEVVLTALLIRAGQVVSTGELMTEIWGECLPRRATAGLHVYISQIRKFLPRRERRDSPVLTQPPGYALRLGTDELDFREFERLMNRGRNAARAGHHELALASFENALTRWRGPLLDDMCRGPILEGFHTWLNEARLECTEMLIDSRLMLGRHREIVSDLNPLIAEHPLREAFHRQLMLALYRCGRRADALDAYRAARRLLHRELGLEPCRELQELHQGILTSDDRLELRVAV